MSKGSKRRPEDIEKVRKNWDKIFKENSERARKWIYGEQKMLKAIKEKK